MGGERYYIKEKIIKYFETNSKPEITIEKLRNNIKKEYFPGKKNYDYDRAFFRAFNKLLDSEIIEVVRYDSDKDRNPQQDFNFNPLFVKYSKRLTRPDIKELLNKMNDDNGAYEKIRSRFKKKLEESNKLGEIKWEYLFNMTFSASINEIWELVSKNENLKEIYDIFKDLDGNEQYKLLSYPTDKYWSLKNEDLFLKFKKKGIQVFIGRKCSIGALFSLISRMNNKNTKIWFFPLSPEKFNSMVESYPTETEKLIEEYSKTNRNDYYLNLWYFRAVDVEGEWNIHDAVWENGFKPHHDMFRNPYTAFELTIDIISTYPENQKIALMEILGKALSDEPGSLQLFMEFYRNIEIVEYKDRLSKIFDVFSKEEEWDPRKGPQNPIDRLTLAIERLESQVGRSHDGTGFIRNDDLF